MSEASRAHLTSARRYPPSLTLPRRWMGEIRLLVSCSQDTVFSITVEPLLEEEDGEMVPTLGHAGVEPP